MQSVAPISAPPPAVLAILVPISDIKTLKAAGIYHPRTIEGWRWAFRMRAERGLERAFVRQGKTVLVNVPAYIAAVSASAA